MTYLYRCNFINSISISFQAGFNAGDGIRYFNIPKSRTPAIVNIASTTNYQHPGLWIFQVDSETVENNGCTSGGGMVFTIELTIWQQNSCLTNFMLIAICLSQNYSGNHETSRSIRVLGFKEFNVAISLGPVYEFVCISFRTGNLNCFRVK